ncbi:T9SS type A sorting domain-containing protein [Hymenobacter sp. H14-R3]|uniref:T9SS type A sorting domain-containing protein n=1 Tax=Hymenobacter sp. H14-R3 TaxID=3046308 RepID=UPI0024B9A42F|nr:T9SS type A sorting domain-containing protein [Hymenobacter sp. H14-R3]MDJ0367901.1 T9SS type A sorting domain-containing protein [Hymenobacter sp. H14-R3]
MNQFPTHSRRLTLLGLGLLAAGPLAAQTPVLTSNGGTLFVNTGGVLTVNGGLTQTGAARLTTTGTATVSGDVSSAAASTLDLSTGLLSVTGNVAQAGPTAGSTGTLRLSGTAAQSLGLNGGTVPNLTVDKASGTATLANAAQVRRVLTLADAGNLATGGNALTLLSDATGTALAVNSSTGTVTGTATVQRYIDGLLNAGNGYRHYSAPVTNTTVADLATNGFTPTLTQRYNTSATPGTTTPFPTVFGYDQSRLASVTNNYAAFDKGFVVPQATDALTPGQGYAVNIGAGQLVDFQGTLGNNDLTLSLARNSGPTAADAGWNLVGNPYPAPLDYSLVQATDRSGLDAAIYVVQSSGQYTGGYRAFVNGQSTTGSNNPLIASGQGFFVRVSSGNTSGALTFRNSQRVTDYATAQTTSFQRTIADTRPALRLTLAGNSLADAWVAYAEAGASPSFEGAFDAAKLPNGHGLNLSSVAGPDQLAIDGRAAFTTATVLPLAVGVPAAGSYTLTASALTNLPAGLTAYLRDAATGTTTALAVGRSYSFSVTAAQALVQGRFTVTFSATALAATPAALAAAVSLYPNPATAQVAVSLPGVAGASTVQADVLDALGRVVLRQQASLPASGTTLTLPTAQLPSGVYVVRLTAGEVVLSRRLTIQ